MSEHQSEIAFLRHCLRYDNSAEHRALHKRITQVQRDERCVRRAICLMAVLTALAVAGLGYAAVLIENFPQDTSQLIAKIISALGLASMICLMAFVSLGKFHRRELHRRREEYRQLVVRRLESRLDKPVTISLRDSRVGDGNDWPVPIAAGGNGSPDTTEATARG